MTAPHHRPLNDLRGVTPGRLAVRPDYYPTRVRPGYPLQYEGVSTGRWVLLSRRALRGVYVPGSLRAPGKAYAGLHAYVFSTRQHALAAAGRALRAQAIEAAHEAAAARMDKLVPRLPPVQYVPVGAPAPTTECDPVAVPLQLRTGLRMGSFGRMWPLA